MANEVHFSGYLGADPETRTVGNTTVTEIRIADTEKWKNKDGQKQERTTWLKIEVWGKAGEAIGEYRSKGGWIGIFGKIQVKQWEDKDGNKRYDTFMKARNQDAIEWGPNTGDGASKRSGGDYGKPSDSPPPSGTDDDIPF